MVSGTAVCPAMTGVAEIFERVSSPSPFNALGCHYVARRGVGVGDGHFRHSSSLSNLRLAALQWWRVVMDVSPVGADEEHGAHGGIVGWRPPFGRASDLGGEHIIEFGDLQIPMPNSRYATVLAVAS